MFFLLFCLFTGDEGWVRNDLELFGLTHLTQAPNGDIFVLDSPDHYVIHLSASGQTLGTFGGEGSGPGEFCRAINIMSDADYVYVDDARNGRIQVFNHQGEFSETITTPEPYTKPLKIMGGWIYQTRPDDDQKACLMVANDHFEYPTELLSWVSMSEKRTRATGCIVPRAINPAPNNPCLVVSPTGDRAYFYKPGLKFEVFIIDGVNLEITSTIVEDSPLTPLDKEWAEKKINRRSERDQARVESSIKPSTFYPEYFPPVAKLSIGPDGLLYVTPGTRWYDGSHHYAYTLDGTPQGRSSAYSRRHDVYYKPGWVVSQSYDEKDGMQVQVKPFTSKSRLRRH